MGEGGAPRPGRDPRARALIIFGVLLLVVMVGIIAAAALIGA